MVGLIFLFLNLVSSLFKSKSRLEAENAALRQQLTVLQRKVRGRVQFTNSDRLFFIQLYHWFPAILKAMTIIRPETLVRWHRAGFATAESCQAERHGTNRAGLARAKSSIPITRGHSHEAVDGAVHPSEQY